MRVRGPHSFKASIDILKHTIVRVVTGTTTTPPEIEPANLVYPAIGVTRSDARAGDIVVVEPLNYDGFTKIRYEYTNGCSVGDILYVTSTGTVTDVDTGGVSAGISLVNISDPNTPTAIVGATGAGGFSRAEDVSVEDSGGYYPDSNVESCLASVGELETLKQRRFSYAGDILTSDAAQPAATLGGRPYLVGGSPSITAGTPATGKNNAIWSVHIPGGQPTGSVTLMAQLPKASANSFVDTSYPMEIEFLVRMDGPPTTTTLITSPKIRGYYENPVGSGIYQTLAIGEADYTLAGTDSKYVIKVPLSLNQEPIGYAPFITFTCGINVGPAIPDIYIKHIAMAAYVRLAD